MYLQMLLCLNNFSSKDKKEERAINYIHFLALVIRQSTALGFVTQHSTECILITSVPFDCDVAKAYYFILFFCSSIQYFF